MSTPLSKLRLAMKANGADAVYIPMADNHDSEYVGDHFACLRHISGFTGSSGTLVVCTDCAALWTDGRYFLQAEAELAGSGITLMKQGLPKTPTPEVWLSQTLTRGQHLFFNGRCVNAKKAAQLERALSAVGVSLRQDLDLVGEIWPARPPLGTAPLWEYPLVYAGLPRGEKLYDLRQQMKRDGIDFLPLSALDEIAWLLNLRGGDIACTPVFLSFFLLGIERVELFVQLEAISPLLQQTLLADGILLRPYEAFYDSLSALPAHCVVSIDRARASSHLAAQLPASCTVLDRSSPIQRRKAVKHPAEIAGSRQAHLKDSIALTSFMYHLKNGDAPATELDAAKLLEQLRSRQADYLGPSFSPIVGCDPHSAIVHYSADANSNVTIPQEGFLLVDSGGHYLQGTTDCTRTFALGALTSTQKCHYTAVLRGNLNLAAARFLQGCTGVNLDYLARAPLWAMGLDFRHGTGHGVGQVLSVHEGPNAIRHRSMPGDTPLLPGMITSNEPGFYLDGQYGIRLENLLLCVEAETTQFGRFLAFETLTLVPFDLDAVDPTQMSPDEIRLLDTYHAQVRETLSPYLNEAQAQWLVQATRPVLG